MAMYWAFDLDVVVARLAYAPSLEGTESIRDAIGAVLAFRQQHPARAAQQVPR
jgi:hypothetical protein